MTHCGDENCFQDVKDLLHSYFPDTKLHDETETTEQIDSGEILSQPDQILPYLQTIFFEEHLLELQLDQSTRIFFTNLLDDIPEIGELESDEEDDGNSSEYEIGSYLKEADSFVITPLNPGVGNARIRACKQVVVRFYMGATAVELGCTFRGQDMLENIPVLRLNFPVIGRVNRNYRTFRVKVITGVDARVCILRPMLSDASERLHQIDDVSTLGLAFLLKTKEQNFDVGDNISFEVQVPGLNNLELEGIVRHISNARGSKGVMKLCGVQFDLETRALATEIERMAASVQRLQLREIAEKTAFLRGVRLVK
jgi:hypothetical protein